MHDPSTQAFQIRYPWFRRTAAGLLGSTKYHTPFVTIWHVDPEKSHGRVCRRGDDTCGWSAPNPTNEDFAAIKKLAREQYSSLFNKQYAIANNASYVSVCSDPDSAYEAIYWCWRAIKRYYVYDADKVVWQYGRNITFKETEEMMLLATNPVDNIKNLFRQIENEDAFVSFFICVHRAFARFHRPWYKHPKWHFWHWRIQLHPWQAFYRRFFQKCCVCNKRGFPKGVAAIGDWNGTRTWHSTCDTSRTNNHNHAQANAAMKAE